MWTLILTIVMLSNSNYSEIKTIHNFETKQLCETAGNQWYKDVTTNLKPYLEHHLGIQFVFTCVNVK